MKIATISARVLLGLVFFASGVSGFLPLNFPVSPGLAGEFQHVFFASHWVQFVDGTEAFVGLALLSGRLVPLALVTLAAIIANIYIFHLTMQPAGVVAPLVLTALWVLAAQPYRAYLKPLLRVAPAAYGTNASSMPATRTRLHNVA